jgi:hypothetical protein
MITAEQPVLSKDYEKVLNEIATAGQFRDYEFEATSQENNLDLSYKELDLKLIGGTALPGSESGLDSLARKAATSLLRVVENPPDYSLVTIVFELYR